MYMEPDYVVVAWPLLSLIIAGIAQGKGRSGLAWFLLSLFFGPLALVALLFFPNLQR